MYISNHEIAQAVQQVKDANVASAVAKMTQPPIENLAPTPRPKARRLSKSERRRQRVQASKRQRMPDIPEEILTPPAAVLRARETYNLTATWMAGNYPGEFGPLAFIDNERGRELYIKSQEGFDRIQQQREVLGYYPGSKVNEAAPHNDRNGPPGQFGGAASPVSDDGDTGHPADDSSSGASSPSSDLKSKLSAALKLKADKQRTKTTKAFRRHQSACRAASVRAFEAAVQMVRAATRSRLDRDGRPPVNVRGEAERLFRAVEARAVGNARRLLESHTGKVYDIHAALLYRAAVNTFIQCVSGVHSNPDAPVPGMDDAADALAKSFSAAFYAMAIKSGCTNVIICSGNGSDGKKIPLKAARLLSGYRCLLPAD